MALKKGQTNSTSFKAGNKANPGGRPAVVKEVRALAQEHTTAAIETLAAICTNADMPAAARVSAANSLLDRGYGKAEATTNVNISRSTRDMTYDELIALASSHGVDAAASEHEIARGLH